MRYTISDCPGNGNCNNHGVCNNNTTKRCDCEDGFAGGDYSQRICQYPFAGQNNPWVQLGWLNVSDNGMHNVVMDPGCRTVVESSSDLEQPTLVCVYRVVMVDNSS